MKPPKRQVLPGGNQGSCRHCLREPFEGESKFKACKSCSIVVYCSRECQTQDWPRHKSTCQYTVSAREADESALPRGLIFSDFIDIHERSINQACYSAACLHNNGVLEYFDYGAHFIHLYLLRRSDSDGNICKAYRIGRVQLLRIDDFDWDKTYMRRKYCHQFRRPDPPQLVEDERRKGIVIVGRMNMFIESPRDGATFLKMGLKYDEDLPSLLLARPERFVPTDHTRWVERLTEIIESGLVWRLGERDMDNLIEERNEKGYYNLCRMKKVKSKWVWEALSQEETKLWANPPFGGLAF